MTLYSDTLFAYPARMNHASSIDAGDFGQWLKRTQAAQPADVPCGECNACCRAGYFIHVADAEHQTRQSIPTELIFPAPGQGGKQWVMGFDTTGACPMLQNNSCSIYTHRPQTCRDYDCRLFSAAGISISQFEEGDAKAGVDRQVKRWRFSYSHPQDQQKHEAIKAAAAFLARHRQQLDTLEPTTATGLALASLHIYKLFLSDDISTPATPALDTVKTALGTSELND